MSGSYRLLITAACGIAALWALFTGAYFGSLYTAHYRDQPTSSAHKGTSADNQRQSQIDRDRAGLPDFAERITAGPDPEQGTEVEKRDLAAQEAMSVWAFWALLVAIGGFIVTTIGTFFLAWQVKLTRDAVEDTSKATQAMERQNEIADEGQRPWVSIDDLAINSVEVDGDIAKITYSFMARNRGKTPAISVCEVLRPFKGEDGNRLNLPAIIREAFKTAVIRSDAIFPDGEAPFNGRQKPIELDAVTTLRFSHPDRVGNGITFTFLIGVVYLDLSGKRVHYSLKSVSYFDGIKGRPPLPAPLKTYLGTVSLDGETT